MPELQQSSPREDLFAIFLCTSDAAYRRKPDLDIPARTTSGIFDFGEIPSDFCRDEKHLIGDEVFETLRHSRTRQILQHYSSEWLAETCQYLRQRYQFCKCTAAEREVADLVRDVFGFNLAYTPEVFKHWIGRALRTTVKVVDDMATRGLPVAGEIDRWNKLAASMADEFRHQFGTLLDEFSTPPLAEKHSPSQAKPMKPPIVQREKRRFAYWGPERRAFRVALNNPSLSSADFESVVRFVDDNELLQDERDPDRLLEAECRDSRKRKVLMNALARTIKAMREMGELPSSPSSSPLKS
jgi:hypothetical protein